MQKLGFWRPVLKHGYLPLLALVLLLTGCPIHHDAASIKYNNPIVEQRAYPWIYRGAAHIRVSVLSNETVDPVQGQWLERGRLVIQRDSFSLDATTFEHRGMRYLLVDSRWMAGYQPNARRLATGAAVSINRMLEPYSYFFI